MNARYRGIFLLDALLGTMIAVTVTTAVVVVAAEHNRGAIKLAQSRSDARALESAMVQLQAGGRVSGGISIQKIDSAAAPPGWEWAVASTGTGPHAMTLCGLIPATGGVK